MTLLRLALTCIALLAYAGGAVGQETQQGTSETAQDNADPETSADQDTALRWRLAGAEWKGELSAVAVDATITARDQRSWNILWQMIGEESPGPLPDGRMAIGVFRAAEEGLPRQLEFSEIVAGETAMVVGFRSLLVPQAQDNAPAAEDLSEQQREIDVTAPYIVRLIPTSQLPVYYVGTVQAQDTGGDGAVSE